MISYDARLIGTNAKQFFYKHQYQPIDRNAFVILGTSNKRQNVTVEPQNYFNGAIKKW